MIKTLIGTEQIASLLELTKLLRVPGYNLQISDTYGSHTVKEITFVDKVMTFKTVHGLRFTIDLEDEGRTSLFLLDNPSTIQYSNEYVIDKPPSILYFKLVPIQYHPDILQALKEVKTK